MHTPGPWHVTGDERGTMITDSTGGQLAIWPEQGGTVEQCANARLIAAAPDLLVIVRALIDIAGTPDELDGTGHHDMADLARMAQAAIARATRGDA